jgi:hypothetical protein
MDWTYICWIALEVMTICIFLVYMYLSERIIRCQKEIIAIHEEIIKTQMEVMELYAKKKS